MKIIILIFSILLIGCVSGTTTFESNLDVADVATPTAYASVDLSTSSPTPTQPTGSSSITSVAVPSTSGAIYRDDFTTWSLSATDGQGLAFDLGVSNPGMIQIAIETAAAEVDGVPNCPFNIKVGSTVFNAVAIPETNPNFHWSVYEIPGSLLVSGANQITFYLASTASTQLFVRAVKFLPRKVVSSGGNLTTTIFTQFGETNQVTGTTESEIWTRGYGLDPTIEMIPGPTLYFNPGDLVSVDLVNLLNPADNEVLNKYDSIMEATVNADESLANDEIRGEINIPHNLNNTNLHVHGLHVDPSKDDVTVVIVPQGVDTAGYDAPHTHKPVSSLDSLNEYSVADQGVKPGAWNYQYKIPEIHLPGTHWFHPHKHGATSAQVENGLAGTIVIRENTTNAIVPFPGVVNSTTGGATQSNYSLEPWQDEHDRVFAIQEITNYGAQFGGGNGQGGKIAASIDVTVNGKDNLTIQFKPNQLERWRLVNAGTNHRAFSHVWLGKNTGQTDPNNNNAPIFQSVDMYLVAVDGVTLPEKGKITAENPALLAPGNRSDFLVQIPDVGSYVLFKNYNISGGLTIQNAAGTTIYNSSKATPVFLPAVANSKNNPYLFANTGTTSENFGGFVQKWSTGNQPVIPIIKTKSVSSGNFLDVNFPVTTDFTAGSTSGWQPGATGAGQISDAELVFINVTGSAVGNSTTPQMPSDDYLATIAPATSGSAPSYVSPLANDDVLQSRPLIFDVSGIGVKVTNTESGKNNTVNQFTLNGRFFALNDPVGNPVANSIIKQKKADPTDIEYGPDQANIPQTLEFVTAGGVKWSSNKVGNGYYFSNPGYFQPLSLSSGTYSYDTTGAVPSWAQLTGIQDVSGVPQPAIVNTNATQYTANESITPSLPVAKTGEEWILINNSDVSHPFHIHINPFFVIEVGQLSYEKFKDKDQFIVRAATASTYPQRPTINNATDNAPTVGTVYQGDMGVSSIVGNWWDTIIIPAHGYVKVRYWFNVPNQTDSNNVISVTDNYNKTGIWVYHCHILRHEDRGMMMPVITQKNAE